MINAGCDLETTGLTPGISKIIQMTWVVYDKDYKTTNEFSTLIQPYDSDLKLIEEAINTGNPEGPLKEIKAAMHVNQIKVEDLKKAPTTMEVRNDFLKWWEDILDREKIYPLGHNFDAFDRQFLKIFFGIKQLNQILHYKSRNTDQVVRFLKDTGYFPSLENTKLVTCCDYFDLPHKAHDSYGDVYAIKKGALSSLFLFSKYYKVF
jgi:DNA polymerase III epsilon subunit-like protein